MLAVRRHLQTVLARTGARVVEMNDDSLVVYDCPEWTSGHTHRLLTRFPDTEIDVRACTASLSGFTVALRRPNRRAFLACVALVGLLLAALACVYSRLA